MYVFRLLILVMLLQHKRFKNYTETLFLNDNYLTNLKFFIKLKVYKLRCMKIGFKHKKKIIKQVKLKEKYIE